MPTSAVVGEVGGAAAEIERQLQFALVIQCAEMVGAIDQVFAFTVEYSFDRFSFGRALASYQALKHRFADMKLWLEASHATSGAAAERSRQAPTTRPNWSAWPSPISATTVPPSCRIVSRCTVASV